MPSAGLFSTCLRTWKPTRPFIIYPYHIQNLNPQKLRHSPHHAVLLHTPYVYAIGNPVLGTLSSGRVSEGSRDYRLGWRLTPSAAGAAPFDINLDATRRESSLSPAAVHGVMLRAGVQG